MSIVTSGVQEREQLEVPCDHSGEPAFWAYYRPHDWVVSRVFPDRGTRRLVHFARNGNVIDIKPVGPEGALHLEEPAKEWLKGELGRMQAKMLPIKMIMPRVPKRTQAS